MVMTDRRSRATLNAQMRLYRVWPERLHEALMIAESAGPSERLNEVLMHIDDAAAMVRAAIALARPSPLD